MDGRGTLSGPLDPGVHVRLRSERGAQGALRPALFLAADEVPVKLALVHSLHLGVAINPTQPNEGHAATRGDGEQAATTMGTSPIWKGTSRHTGRKPVPVTRRFSEKTEENV